MKLITFISAGAFIFLSGFMLKKQTGSLFESKWNLKTIYSKESSIHVNTGAYIRFDQKKNSAGGNGSCNNFGSNISIIGNKINFTNTFSTKMYCAEVQETEDIFFKQLSLVNRYKVSDNKLRLYYGKKLLLEFTGE